MNVAEGQYLLCMEYECYHTPQMEEWERIAMLAASHTHHRCNIAKCTRPKQAFTIVGLGYGCVLWHQKYGPLLCCFFWSLCRSNMTASLKCCS